MASEEHVIHSPFRDVEIPKEESVAELLLKRSSQWLTRPAAINIVTDEALSYGDFAEQLQTQAAEIRSKLQPGFVVGLWSPNDVEYLAIVHSIALAGGIVLPVDATATDGECERQLRDATARLLIVHTTLAAMGTNVSRRVGVESIVFGEGLLPPLSPASSPQDSRGSHAGQDAELDTFILLNGTATAGLPKSVVLRHTDVISTCAELEPAEGRFLSKDGEVVLFLAPLSRSFGALMGLAFLPYKGATMLLSPAHPASRLDCDQLLAAAAKYKASSIYLSPSSLRQLVGFHGLHNYDLSSLRRVVTFGAALAKDLQLQAAELLGCVVKQSYGVTEASAMVAVAPDDAVKAGTGAVGPLLANTAAQIVDVVTHEPLPQGSEGELLVKSRAFGSLTGGYWTNTRASEAAYAKDGFVKTGDVAKFDEDGYLYVLRRNKDVIITSAGLPVSPAELESLLLLHPDVDDVCVLGKPDSEEGGSGEVPMAVVVPMDLKEAGPELKDALIAFVQERAAPHKQLCGGVVFVNAIPYRGAQLNRQGLRAKLVSAGVL